MSEAEHQKARPKLPDYLAKYQQSPEEILGGRLIPPARPKGVENQVFKRHPNTLDLTQLAYVDPNTHAGIAPPVMPTPRTVRQVKYTSPEALQYAIDLYFDKAEATRGMPEFEEPTVPGLAYALGFATRQAFVEYRKDDADDGYQFVVKRALTLLESFSNQKILKGGPATPGTIFNLKNQHGWSDKMEQTTTHKVGGTLEAMLEAMQGRVLRPMMPTLPTPDIIDAEVIAPTATTEHTQTIAPTLEQQKYTTLKPTSTTDQDDEELW
jgi:hypothetical protein